MSFLRWLKKVSNAETHQGLENMLSENKFFKKVVLSLYSVPEKLLAKIEEDVHAKNPHKNIQILLPEHPESEARQGVKEGQEGKNKNSSSN